ncbi:MAG: hypothetical protein P0S93_05080 [Candidatus Neptunochlamydia sp.]|nr:hypothetical protein [Candidatus Neptunochlamydia sp.]
MKKLISILILFAFTLYANEASPIENPDTEPPPDASSPVYATPNPPVREREETPSNTWKATAAVIPSIKSNSTHYF